MFASETGFAAFLPPAKELNETVQALGNLPIRKLGHLVPSAAIPRVFDPERDNAVVALACRMLTTPTTLVVDGSATSLYVVAVERAATHLALTPTTYVLMAKSASDLLTAVLGKLGDGRAADAFDLLYSRIEDALLASNLELAEAVMRLAVQQSDVPLRILVGILTVTLPWKETLRATRDLVVAHVAERADRDGGPKKAEALLSGLR
jgi:hypothetical protein